ncbi:MAG: hypothetical protein JNJ40_05935 [Bacteroidia bacterium]|nr:hypothetical protein [Bacteroidia bacterium]
MKIKIIFAMLFATTLIAQAQNFNTTGTSTAVYRDGKTGFGMTTAPATGNPIEVETIAAETGIIITQKAAGGAALYLNNIYNGGRKWALYSLNNNNTPAGGHFLIQDATSATNRFMINGTNGNIGVGTISPLNKIHISTATADDGLLITQTGVGSAGLILNNTTSGGKQWSVNSLGNGSNHGAGNFAIYDNTSNNNRFFISGSNGNIGIGTTSPAQKLDVAGNINTNGTVTIGSNFILGSSGSFKNNAWAGTGNRVIVTDASGNLSALTQGSATQVLYGNGVWGNLPAATFAESGNNITLPTGKNLGIGVTTPTVSFEVGGDAKFRGALNADQGMMFDSNNGFKLATVVNGGSTTNVFAVGKQSNVNTPFITQCAAPQINQWVMSNGGGFISAQNNLATPYQNVNGSVKMYAAGWNGSGYIEVEGVDETGATNNSLNMNYFCGRNINMCTNNSLGNGGGKVYVGNYFQAAQHVQIGDPTWSIASNNSPANNVALELYVNNGKAVKAKTYTGNLSMFEVENVANSQVNTTFKVTGDGVAHFGYIPTTASGAQLNIYSGLTDALEVYNTTTGKAEVRVKSDGKIYAREVIVTLNTFPDYVFAQNYKLPELSDVKNYIQKNHRLMNMPSANEVAKDGANIGEIQKVTVEKLEEAYLYILQLEEKLNVLSTKVESLEKKK